MAKGDLIVGIDIGTTKVCTLIAELGSGDGSATDRLKVVGTGTVPSNGVKRGVIVDIDETSRAIRESVDLARKMAGADIHSAIVGVTGEHISSMNTRGTVAIAQANHVVTPDDVNRVLENSRQIVLPPEREILHALPRDYAIDGQNGIRSPIGMCGSRLEVETHIVTGATSFLRNVVTCVEHAGIHVEELVLEPLATGEAVLLDAEKRLGVAVLDIGGGTSDLAIFQGGDICYTSVIPVGGEYVTKDISMGLRLSFEEAERVKRAFGHARPAAEGEDAGEFEATHIGESEPVMLSMGDLAEIIESRVEELFHLVAQDLVRSGFAEQLPAGFVLTGGGSLLCDIREVASEWLGLPVRVTGPHAMAGLAESAATPSNATGIGLLRWGALTHAAIHPRNEGGGLLAALMQWTRRVLRDVFGH